MKQSLIFLFLGFMFSCESLVQNVDPDKIPLQEPQLVVNSFISPSDSIISVSVSLSKPIYGKNEPIIRYDTLQNGEIRISEDYYSVKNINNASVVIKNNGESKKLLFNNNTLQYEALNNGFIQASKTYTLEVFADNKKTTANSTVPTYKPEITDTNIKVDSSSSPFRDYIYYIPSIKWQDQEKEENFYLVKMIMSYKTYYSEQGKENSYTQPVPLSRDNKPSTYNDILNNGIQINSGDYELAFIPYSQEGSKVEKSLKISLLSIDETFYKYQTSLFNHSRNNGNPFAETTFIYSNIEGGLGCFASYLESNIEMTLE